MAADLSSAANILKTRFEGTVVDLFESFDGDYKKVEARKKDTRGGDVEFPIRTSRNWRGIGSQADGSAINTAGNQGWQKYIVDPKLTTQVVKIDGAAHDRTRGGPSVGTYLELLLSEMKHGLEDLRKTLNWQVHGSEEGYLAKIASVDDGNDTVTVDLSTAAQAIGVGQFGTDRLFGGQGMYVDIVDSNGTTVHAADLLISSVTRSSGLVQLPASTNLSGVADGDFIALHSPGVTAGANQWDTSNRDMEGMLSGIDNGDIRTSYHGVSRSTYPVTQANVVEAGTSSAFADLAESHLQSLVQACLKNGQLTREELKSSFEFCLSYGMESEYLALQLPGRRYSGPMFNGGSEEEMTYAGIPLRPSPDARAGQISLINWDYVELYEQAGIGWVDYDGNILHRVHGTYQFELMMRLMAEMVWSNQNKMGVIRYLNEDPVEFRY